MWTEKRGGKKSIRGGEWLSGLYAHKPKASSPAPLIPICLRPRLKIHELKTPKHLHQRWKQHFSFLFFFIFFYSRMTLEAKQFCRRYRVTSNRKSGALQFKPELHCAFLHDGVQPSLARGKCAKLDYSARTRGWNRHIACETEPAFVFHYRIPSVFGEPVKRSALMKL